MSSPPAINNNNNEKFVQYLNEALAMENAAAERIRSRADETPIEQAKQQLQYHLEQTIQQQNRLKGAISKMGGQPTSSKATLPAFQPMNAPMSVAEQELVRTKEDAIIENAEVTSYKMLMQMAEKAGLKEIVPALQESLQEEVAMVNFISANAPLVLTKLWQELGMYDAAGASFPSYKQQQQKSQGSSVSMAS
jgi:ferritin-like metal-binding protein YciE